MKIAFITESFPELSETFILAKAVELKKRGHDVTVFTQFKRDHRVHPDLLAGLDLARDVVRLPTWDRVRGKDITRALAAAGAGLSNPGRLAALSRARSGLGLVKLLPFLRRRFDVVHAHYAYMGRRWLEAVEMSSTPLVVSILGHDLTYHYNRHQQEYGPLFARAAHFFASSEYLAGRAREAGADGARLSVLYPEVDTDFFAEVDRTGREGPLNLLTVGRLDWTKGFIYALEAVRKLVARGVDCRYLIVGEGAARSEVEEAITDFDLAGRVVLAGAKDREGCREEFARADVFLLASVSESFGLAAAEAMATGLPVVASAVGGLPEVVADNLTGSLTPTRDPAALADAVARLAASPDLRTKMGRAGRERVRERFDRGLIIGQMIAEYEKVKLKGDHR